MMASSSPQRASAQPQAQTATQSSSQPPSQATTPNGGPQPAPTNKFDYDQNQKEKDYNNNPNAAAAASAPANANPNPAVVHSPHNKNKELRREMGIINLVGLVACLALTIVGAALIDPPHGFEYMATCSCLVPFLLIVYSFTSFPTQIISVAFMLALVQPFIELGMTSTDSKVQGGVAISVIGMTVPFLFAPENLQDKGKNAANGAITAIENIVGVVAVLVNLLGCILYWGASKNTLLAAQGTTAFLSSCIFIAAWFMKDAPMTWVGFVWFAVYQYIALAGPVAGCAFASSQDVDLCKAGGTFQWLAHWTFIVLFFFRAAGPDFMTWIKSIPNSIKNVKVIVVIVLFVIGIIGAIVAAENDYVNQKGWITAQALFSVLFVAGAMFLALAGGPTEKESGAFFVATGMLFVASGALCDGADADRRNGGDNRQTGGDALLLIAMWGSFVVAASDMASAAGGAVSGLIAGGALGIATIVLGLVHWIGLALVWRYNDDSEQVGSIVATSITAMLIFFLFVWAVVVKKGGLTALLSLFLTAYTHIVLLSQVLAIRDYKDGSDPAAGEVKDLNILMAGLVLLFVCHIVYMALALVVLGADPNAGTAGAGVGLAVANDPNANANAQRHASPRTGKVEPSPKDKAAADPAAPAAPAQPEHRIQVADQQPAQAQAQAQQQPPQQQQPPTVQAN